jgi:hypothetical protein
VEIDQLYKYKCSWNGTSWTEVNDLILQDGIGAGGTQTAGILLVEGYTICSINFKQMLNLGMVQVGQKLMI